jgi:hypothetical protein
VSTELGAINGLHDGEFISVGTHFGHVILGTHRGDVCLDAAHVPALAALLAAAVARIEENP